MTVVQSTPDLSKYLLALKSSDADAAIISTLVSLNGLNPTVSDLNSSRIHLYLAQNVAKRSGVTGELARQLVAKETDAAAVAIATTCWPSLCD
jgi:hypothetical protein